MQMVQSKEIIEAKRKLFYLLLDCQNDTLTDSEVEIMFLLSKDRDIREIINKAITVKRRR